jgi:hypothetical protein
VFDIVDSVYRMSASAAARATAASASRWNNSPAPVGATMIGDARSKPSRRVRMSMRLTSTRVRVISG